MKKLILTIVATWMIAAILNAQENKTAYEISLEETEVVGIKRCSKFIR